jgi:poly-beta-1,6-N-acetyl-D-glucosamine synthase
VKAVEIAFWVSAGLIVYTHAGYPLLLAGLARLRRRPLWRAADLPRVSLVIAAHDEREVIEERVTNALALDYPPDRLEVIVVSDGSTDGTAELAVTAADGDLRVHVMDLDRRGKVRAQDAAVDTASGEILAFSDANALWEPGALQALMRPFSD